MSHATAPITGSRSTGALRVDMTRVKARKDAVVRQSNEGVTKWLRNTPNLTVLRRPCAASRGPRTVGVNGTLLEAGTDLPQRRRAGVRARHARARRGRLPDQLEHDGRRFPARAPGRHRRQLHRTRIRADVSPLRQPGDGRGDGTASDRARGRGRSPPRSRRSSRTRASRSGSTQSASAVAKHGNGVAVGLELRGRAAPRSRARICCWPSAACPTPTISGSTRPA